ncbi:MAG: DUF2070 family protein [Candidatus Bathyarchaeia archaeon]
MDDEDYIKVKKTTPYYNLIKTIGFPSLRKILITLFSLTSLSGGLAYLAAGQEADTLKGVFTGLTGLAVPSLLFDALTSKTLLRNESIFNLRRLYALSLFSSTIWAVCMVLGGLASKIIPSLQFPSDPTFIWLFITVPLRSLVLTSVSTPPMFNRLASSLITPSISVAVFTYTLSLDPAKVMVCFAAAALIGRMYTTWLLKTLDRIGAQVIGVSPVSMFRGILKALLEEDDREFESMLNDLSVERELDIVTLGFRAVSDGKLKSAIIVSNFHPGPFLNVGSSSLPKKIMEAVKARFKIPAAVPHGVSGHEMNLVSQKENEKVIQNVLEMLNSKKCFKESTPPVSITHEGASSTCQIFGKCPFITLTLSPKTMEDIPLETGAEIQRHVRRYFKYAAVVDAHNCISQVTVLSQDDLNALKESAFQALKKAVNQNKHRFKLGVAEIELNEYGPDLGVGSGGGIVQMFEVGSLRSVYITFDANNMSKDLREKMLSIANKLGAHEAEVMTTDTHEVNGRVPAKLGYYPLGEKVDVSTLVRKVKSSLEKAEDNLEEVKVFHEHRRIKVKVLGLKLFKDLTGIGYKMARLIASSLIPILGASILAFAVISRFPWG